MDHNFDLNPPHIFTSELGYYVIAELVTMEDRDLAKRIELFIWPNSPLVIPARILALVKAIAESECEEDFARMAMNVLDLYPDDGFNRPDKRKT